MKKTNDKINLIRLKLSSYMVDLHHTRMKFYGMDTGAEPADEKFYQVFGKLMVLTDLASILDRNAGYPHTEEGVKELLIDIEAKKSAMARKMIASQRPEMLKVLENYSDTSNTITETLQKVVNP